MPRMLPSYFTPFSELSAVWLPVAAVLVVLAWISSQQVRTFWLRSLLRALVLTALFTPTPFFRPGTLSPTVIIPAWSLLIHAGRETDPGLFIWGAFPILFLTAVLWIPSLAFRCLWCRYVAQPGAAPNGGHATQLGNSGVTKGPPSVN